MVLLTQLPSEIINNIFGYVSPDDLPSIRSICRRLADHVKGNAVLHRDIYYRYLDEPPEDVDWEQSLNDVVKLRKLCGREYEDFAHPKNFELSCSNIHEPKMTFVHHAVTNLLKAIPPSSSQSARGSCSEYSIQQPVFSSYPLSRNAAILLNLFSKESVRNAFLHGSQLYERADGSDYRIPMSNPIDYERSRYGRTPVNYEYQQQSAKLHCLFGVGVQAPATLTLPDNPALSSSLNRNQYPPHPRPGPGTNNSYATMPSPPLPTREGRLRSAFFARTSLVPKLYPYAVSKVYDLREYTTKTHWGPFRADGSGKVDWEKMEAILFVLRTNIKLKELDRIPMVGNVWNTPFAGCWEGSLCELPRTGSSGPQGGGPMGVGSGYGGWFLWGNTHEDGGSDIANDGAIDSIMEQEQQQHEEEDGDSEDGDLEEEEDDRNPKLEAEDPYGVSGVWLRVVCFLDYTDFFSFNFPDDSMPDDNVPRPPLDVGEATKLLMMKINVTRITYPEPGTGHPEIKGKVWPVVHWKGYARSFDGSPGEARLTWGLRGVVRMSSEGEVRWTTSSLYDGEERWRSEGIQIGGVKSARGVIGNWFDKDHNPHGPCGPTAFWKISDLEAVRPRGGQQGEQEQQGP